MMQDQRRTCWLQPDAKKATFDAKYASVFVRRESAVTECVAQAQSLYAVTHGWLKENKRDLL